AYESRSRAFHLRRIARRRGADPRGLLPLGARAGRRVLRNAVPLHRMVFELLHGRAAGADDAVRIAVLSSLRARSGFAALERAAGVSVRERVRLFHSTELAVARLAASTGVLCDRT